MKNYMDSDYALNKKNTGAIVYRFADGSLLEVTLADYLAENPGKTEEDFQILKALSDADYRERDRDEYRQTWKNVTINGLEETDCCAGDALEDEVIEQPEREVLEAARHELALQALDLFTEAQRRRYLLYAADGLTTREIAAREGASQRTVMDSIQWAEKKIKKFLANAKK